MNFYPRTFWDADDGNSGAAATGQEQQTDYGKLLEGVNLDELLKQDAIAKKVQSIADSRVSQALTTAKTKWEAEKNAEKDEATRLANMTETEREKYQFERDKASFLEEKAKFAHAQLQVETAKQLIGDGLPDLSAYITGKDAEETKNNIANLRTILGAWKADTLKTAMAGKTPDGINPAGQKITSKAEIAKMTPAEINKAYEEGRIDLKNLK